jgi:hypothetical protein
MLALLITGGVLGAVAPVGALLRWAARPAMAAYRRGWTVGVQHGQAQVRQDQAAERMARERRWPNVIVIRSAPARRGRSPAGRVSCAASGNARQHGVRRCAAAASPDHNRGPRR